MVFAALGAFTVTLVEARLFAGLASPKSWLAVNVWLPSEVVVLVVQLNVTAALAPAVRPGTGWLPPIGALSVTSCRLTLIVAPTAWLPTFLSVTTTLAVFPWLTEGGALTLVIAISVTGVGGGVAPSSTCTEKLFSTRSMRFAIVCVELPANSSPTGFRSEERRVGKECRSGVWTYE